MAKLFAIAVPILPGKTIQWKKFASELNGVKKKDFEISCNELEIRERTFLQQTPAGDFAIVTIEGDNPSGAFEKFTTGRDPFTKWFLNEVKEIHGIDFSQINNTSLPEMIVDSGNIGILHS
jgi:hypothetical protein